ncbi:MAG: hypothetical protein NZ524_08930 [Thiobacillaceae bacterium]|nr:hypothetical protein [Thiobacillaceae bacterium]MCX7672180.1 hypothetical protein [Thiobacillaceae bacterium]MDW8324055.1 hypothetical protein [Burkholderiales bacterium]
MSTAADPAGGGRWAWLRWAITAALAANIVLFAEYGRLSETIDTLAWFVLLVLYLVESEAKAQLSARVREGLRLLRLPAGALVVWAAVAYVLEREWLDAANAWLWLAVVALLELALRWPTWVARNRAGYVRAVTAVYGGLFAFALAWLLQGEWLDAWDAALWLAAFFLIELDLLGRRPAAVTAPRSC